MRTCILWYINLQVEFKNKVILPVFCRWPHWHHPGQFDDLGHPATSLSSVRCQDVTECSFVAVNFIDISAKNMVPDMCDHEELLSPTSECGICGQSSSDVISMEHAMQWPSGCVVWCLNSSFPAKMVAAWLRTLSKSLIHTLIDALSFKWWRYINVRNESIYAKMTWIKRRNVEVEIGISRPG